MSDSTWICITPSPFWDGRLETRCCRDLCRCDRKCLRRHDLIDCLLGNDSMDKIGASTTHFSISTTFLVPTSHPLTVPAAREPGTRFTSSTTPTVVRLRPRTSRDPVAHHIATESRLRPSFFVHRELTAVSSFVLPPSRWPTPAGRRGHAATPFLLRGSATRRQFDIDTFRATSCRIVIINLLPSVHTFSRRISSEAQHRTVSRISRKAWLSSSVSEAMDASVRERY